MDTVQELKDGAEDGAEDGAATAALTVSYGLMEQKTRKVPVGFGKEDRESFLVIAERASFEAVNCYTVVSLGSQSYMTNRRFIR